MRFFIKACQMSIFAALFVCAATPSHAEDLISALNLKMKYLGQNQAVISKNLANSNTPGYKALELQEPKYTSKNGPSLSMTTTSPMHIASISKSGGFKTVKQKDTYETAPNGNNVSIEEQMVKMSANNTEHQSAANLLKKANSLMNLATGER